MKPTAKAGDCVGDWLLKFRRGAGQSGVVWVAEEQVWPFRTGALKICCGAFVTIRKSRFRRESRFVRKRIAREHRTELYGWGSWNGFPYYVTELGEELPDGMTTGDIRTVFGVVAEGIAEMHEAGLLYGDPKKENVVLVKGVAKMIDFGSVTPIRYAEMKPRRIGTWRHMPDEVREGRAQLAASDVAAFGSALDEVCTGAGSQRAFGPLIRRMTDPDWRNRPTMAEARRMLRHCHDGLRRWIVLVAGVVVLVVAVCAVSVGGRVAETATLAADDKAYEMAEAAATAGLLHMSKGKYEMAVRRLRQAANVPGYSNVEVYRALSDCYRLGLGVKADGQESRKWAKKARGY